MKKLLMALVLLSTPALAESEWSIELSYGVNTTHLSDAKPVQEHYALNGRFDMVREYTPELNEDNSMMVVELRKAGSDWGFTAASFENSYYRDSLSFGVSYSIVEWEGFELSALAGLVSGYTYDEARTSAWFSDYRPYIAPRVSYHYDLTDSVALTTNVALFRSAVVTSVGIKYGF